MPFQPNPAHLGFDAEPLRINSKVTFLAGRSNRYLHPSPPNPYDRQMRTVLLSLIALLPTVQLFAIPTNGLVHHFELNQSLDDSATQSSPLTSPGSAAQYNSGHLSHLSNDFAASFDGAGSYLTVATDFTEQRVSQSYTVSAWFKPDLAPSASQEFYVYETSPNFSVSLALREGDDASKTKVQFVTQTDSNDGLEISTEIPDSEITARWYHAALTFDGTALIAYVDGAVVGTLDLTEEGELKSVTALNVGTYRSADGNFFDGLIDEVAVWNLALTPGEIKDLSDAAAITHYVNYLNNGLESAPYDSWNTAAVDLQDALAIARPGDEIWIAQGTYYPDQGGGQTLNDRAASFTLKDRVAIYGGFLGTETSNDEADPTAYPTILSGDIDQNNGAEEPDDFANHSNNSYHVVTAENVDETALLDGVTIKYGFADGAAISDQIGAGLYCQNASPVLTQVTFELNAAVGGGAIASNGASPTIANSTFRKNTAQTGGAFITLNSSSPSIINSVFYDNTGTSRGGAFFNFGSSPILTNCTLYGNSSEQEGGAIYNAATSLPTLQNCIIWNNQADGLTNTADASIRSEEGSNTVASHSIVENISKATLDASGTATNLEPTDPLFLLSDPTASGNFQLRGISPALDAGDNDANATTTDIAKNDRIQNTTIDLGAYEFIPYTQVPVIVLSGATDIFIAPDTTWIDPGVTAIDEGGDAISITTGGDTVDTTQTTGVFTITYDAIDSFDNTAVQVTRTVYIVGEIDYDPDSNNQFDILSWTDGWALQTSTDLIGWTDVPDAQSPFEIAAITEGKKFWRLRKAD